MKTLNAIALALSIFLVPLAARAGTPTLDLSLPADTLASESPALGSVPAPEASVQETRSTTTIFGLPRNIGDGERIIRGVVAAALIGVGAWGLATGELSDGASGALLGVSSVPLLTAATGYCPLYHAFGFDTRVLDFY